MSTGGKYAGIVLDGAACCFGGGAGASFAAQCGTNGGPGCFVEDSPKNNPKVVTYARGNGGGSGADSQDCSVNPSGNKCR
jgi:hypothetical protein